MNAIIGDNGIITRAQEATVLQNCANLEEYLNQEYIVGVADDRVENGESEVKLTPLEQMIRLHSDYFFKNGSYDYVIYEYTSDEGKTEYLKIRLINKEKLGEDVKNQLSIGDAKGNSREAYLEFEDVFGVTEDLKVFYCKKGMLSAIGADFLKSSLFDDTKVLYKKESPAAKALAESTNTTEKDLTISDLRSTQELTVSNESGATDLSFLVDMPKVTKLTLTNYAGKLNGIENLIGLTYLYINNTKGGTNITYDGLRENTNLEELYFLMPTNEELKKMCTEMGNSDYKKLSKLCVFGFDDKENAHIIDDLPGSFFERRERNTLDNIESLSKLSNQTKQAIKILYLNNNSLKSLKGLEGFSGINKLYVNNNSINNSTLQIGNSLNSMINLNVLFCGYDNITNEDFQNISVNKNLTSLSIPGNSLITDLDILKVFTKLSGLQARANENFILSDDVIIQKIASLSEYYLDQKYSVSLALANIGSEVFLGVDASDSDISILLSKKDVVLQGVEKLEIPNNRKISNDKLQTLLKKLTNLKLLWADNTNLSSLDFIEETNDKLEYISIFDTSILNLGKLKNCTRLKGININTQGLNLKNYSDLVSEICERDGYSGIETKGGRFYCGGFNATAEILNTLNGEDQNSLNENLTCFGSYGDPVKSGADIVDFTNTKITKLKPGLWNALTIKLPSCFNDYKSDLCRGGCKLDYTNLTSANEYDCQDLSSVNFTNFNGYETVSTNVEDPTSIVGSVTEKLSLGKCSVGKLKQPSKSYKLAEIVSDGTNITNMTIWGGNGFSDILILNPLKLTNLEIQYSSLYGLGLNGTTVGNMANSLTTLKIMNCTTFNSLDGLNQLSKIQTLDLTNDSSLGNIQTITKENGSKESKNTCQYIVDSLKGLKSVTLRGCGIDNFDALISNGFKETEYGSRVFVKGN